MPLTAQEMSQLKYQYERIVRACGIKARKKTIAEECARDISRYQAPGRFYHNLTHIKNMLNLINEHVTEFEQPWLVRFAALKHDVIYDVHNTRDNETHSAIDAATTGARLGMKERHQSAVVRLIMATEHLGNQHRALRHDEKLLADIDLDGFSRSWDTVLGNARRVRAEFAHVSDDDFAKGQNAFLVALQMRGFIYQSDVYKAFEERACENILLIRQELKHSIVVARPTDKFSDY
ncbi:MAG: hypothetical protein RLZZ234_793 [Candidatus Parcubacteria bacterium]